MKVILRFVVCIHVSNFVSFSPITGRSGSPPNRDYFLSFPKLVGSVSLQMISPSAVAMSPPATSFLSPPKLSSPPRNSLELTFLNIISCFSCRALGDMAYLKLLHPPLERFTGIDTNPKLIPSSNHGKDFFQHIANEGSRPRFGSPIRNVYTRREVSS